MKLVSILLLLVFSLSAFPSYAVNGASSNTESSLNDNIETQSKNIFQKALDKASKTIKKISGEKSQIIALILAIFTGIIGIHRFYLGYTTIGIIQLLTLGGLGIWTLIDIIRIITGDLQPADGAYDETFDEI